MPEGRRGTRDTRETEVTVAAAGDLEGTFMLATSPADQSSEGLDKVSATVLSMPVTYPISLVNNAMYESWQHCLALHRSEDWCRAKVNGSRSGW
jgi:hypothetical protein